jgi:hypothetical protein
MRTPNSRVELLREDGDDEEPRHVFKFQVNAVLRPGSEGFDADLLYALNLLQENVGAVGIFTVDSTREDYLKTITVGWEILPPGERDDIIVKMLGRMRNPSDEAKERIAERYDVLASLKPTAYISGTSGFQRYFGAKFAENLVVFENLEYGNAIYVMFDDWEHVSQQSRLQLLKGDDSKFVRIVHAKGWKRNSRFSCRNGSSRRAGCREHPPRTTRTFAAQPMSGGQRPLQVHSRLSR